MQRNAAARDSDSRLLGISVQVRLKTGTGWAAKTAGITFRKKSKGNQKSARLENTQVTGAAKKDEKSDVPGTARCRRWGFPPSSEVRTPRCQQGAKTQGGERVRRPRHQEDAEHTAASQTKQAGPKLRGQAMRPIQKFAVVQTKTTRPYCNPEEHETNDGATRP